MRNQIKTFIMAAVLAAIVTAIIIGCTAFLKNLANKQKEEANVPVSSAPVETEEPDSSHVHPDVDTDKIIIGQDDDGNEHIEIDESGIDRQLSTLNKFVEYTDGSGNKITLGLTENQANSLPEIYQEIPADDGSCEIGDYRIILNPTFLAHDDTGGDKYIFYIKASNWVVLNSYIDEIDELGNPEVFNSTKYFYDTNFDLKMTECSYKDYENLGLYAVAPEKDYIEDTFQILVFNYTKNRVDGVYFIDIIENNGAYTLGEIYEKNDSQKELRYNEIDKWQSEMQYGVFFGINKERTMFVETQSLFVSPAIRVSNYTNITDYNLKLSDLPLSAYIIQYETAGADIIYKSASGEVLCKNTLDYNSAYSALYAEYYGDDTQTNETDN